MHSWKAHGCILYIQYNYIFISYDNVYILANVKSVRVFSKQYSKLPTRDYAWNVIINDVFFFKHTLNVDNTLQL